ncbi:MAG: hypothetical protein NTX25_04050, partial [Proteobacteria bacterium]|nr:hypothetical protein [Pseudomonadota bacterium]
MARKNRDIWNKNSIELTKGEITTELDLILRKTGELECLHYILEKIKILEDSNDPSSLQRRFLYILSGLHHNKLFGGLGKKQIADLASLAQTILFVSEIKPSHSTVSFLYSELHNTISDIYYSKGEYLPSVWERMLGTHIASLPVEQLAQQSLNMGINVLRLGNSALALEYFTRGINQSPDSNILDQLRLHIVKTTRLSGKLAEAENLLQELTPLITNSLYKLEFDWEKSCLNASLNGDLVGLFFLTKKTSPLYTSSKMLELFFWSYAHAKTQWSQRLNK